MSTHIITNDDHKRFIDIAKNIAKFSRCQSIKVGCIMVKDRRIISSGCNGSPSGSANCDSIFDSSRMKEPSYREQHHKFSESVECHAEENAIIMAARYGNALDGCVVYVSLKPCERCLKMLANLNIKYIYYADEYDKFKEYSEPVVKMIQDLQINIIKIA